MKYLLIITAVLLVYGCSTKHKLLSQKTQSNEMSVSDQAEKRWHYSHTLLRQQSDSAIVQQWFKIYPKGEVQFNNGNFSGQIDSLLWYAKNVNLQKQLQSQQHDTIATQRQQKIVSTLHKTDEYIKEKQRQWLSWWPIMLLLLIALVAYLIMKQMNWKRARNG